VDEGEVRGTIKWIAGAPQAHAFLRLRDLTTGAVPAVTTADQSGRFRFERVPAGRYAIELLIEDTIAAVSRMVESGGPHPVDVTLAPAVRPAQYNGFLRSAAPELIAAASARGVTALGASGRDVGPR
jgi:hypothetical protein